MRCESERVEHGTIITTSTRLNLSFVVNFQIVVQNEGALETIFEYLFIAWMSLVARRSSWSSTINPNSQVLQVAIETLLLECKDNLYVCVLISTARRSQETVRRGGPRRRCGAPFKPPCSFLAVHTVDSFSLMWSSCPFHECGSIIIRRDRNYCSRILSPDKL